VTTGLAIDLGTATVGAIAVTDRGAWLVPDPTSGENRWRSAVHWDGRQVVVGALAEHRRRTDPGGYAVGFTRTLDNDEPVQLGARRFRAVELVAELLSAIRSEAQRRYGPVDRAVVTIPADHLPGDPRRARMVAAAEAAGFLAVELLVEAVAVACAPLPGPPFAEADLVLVYDLGADFEATVVRIRPDMHEVIGHARITEFTTGPATMMEQTFACCLDLLAGLAIARADLAAVIPVGGGCRTPGIDAAVERGLDVGLSMVDAPELAVVRGAAHWLPHSSPREVPAEPSAYRMAPLAFTIPGGSARLLRWLVSPAQPYREGSVLARVRLASGAVWDLTARSHGTLEQILIGDGAQVTTGEWLALSRH
jgi:molecular chaperone DnaK (HSP70)